MTEKKTSHLFTNLLKYVVPLVVSVGLCWLLFTGIDFKEMMSIIREQCDFRWIALGFVFSIAAQVFRAYRWAIQLRALSIVPPIHVLVYSIFGTYSVNLVFPRLGEVWRCGYIAQRQNSPFTSVFGSMVADRLSDTVAVALITLFAFAVASDAILGFLRQNSASYAAIAGILRSPWLWGACVAVVAAVWIFMRRRSSNKAVIKIQKAVRELWQGFAVIVKMPGKGRWLLFTVGIWTCYFMQMYVSFYAFPFTEATSRQLWHAGSSGRFCSWQHIDGRPFQRRYRSVAVGGDFRSRYLRLAACSGGGFCQPVARHNNYAYNSSRHLHIRGDSR